MDLRVRVTADENGNVIGVSKNNPEFGYIRVEQLAPTVSATGWLSVNKRSALIKGKVEELQMLNYCAGHELPGQIVIKESHVPFSSTQPNRDLKIAGFTGVVCRVGDEPIYRQAVYTSNPTAFDELIAHDNTEEIKHVQAAQKAMSTLKTGNTTEKASSLRTEAQL